MKLRLIFWTAALAALCGCNGIGAKDEILARIDSEKVYKEDFNYLILTGRNLSDYQGKFLYDNLYSKAALAARALKEYPIIEEEWDEYYKFLGPRLLTVVFQRFYASDKMTYTDNELRQFFETHKPLFSNDSLGYLALRKQIAEYYYAYQNKEAFDAYKQSLAEKNTDTLSLIKSFANIRRGEIQKELSENLFEKTHVAINQIPQIEAKDFYKKHEDLFMSPASYELYQIDGDSLALSLLELKNLEDFKIAAAKANNAYTAKDSGYVGVVKKNFALPYGIGIVDSLSKVLEGKSSGYITAVLKSNQGTFHRFYLTSTQSEKLKSFERVKSGIEAHLLDGSYFDIDSATVLLTKNGMAFFTEKDMLRFNELFIKNRMNKRLHQKLLTMLADNIAYAELAKKLKLNRSWEYRAMVRDARRTFIEARYVDYVTGLDSITEDSLKVLYQKVGSPFHVGYSFEDAKRDLRLLASFPKNLQLHDYYMCYRVIYAGKTFEESIASIYTNRNETWKTYLTERLSTEAYLKASVHLYDSAILEYKPDMIADSMLKKADSLYKADRKSVV